MNGISESGPTRRDALCCAVGAGAVLLGQGTSEEASAAEQPRIYTRREWKAKPPRGDLKVRARPPDKIVIHHTASANVRDYSLEQAFRLSRDIQRFHTKRRRWDDIGQQLTISRGGFVMEGREGTLRAIQGGRHIVGAQSLRHNHHSIGIENEGMYRSAPVPARLWSSLVKLCAWLCTAYELNPARAIVGHRDFNATECPGDVLYKRLPELRRAVARRLRMTGPFQEAPPLPGNVPLPRSTERFDHGPAGDWYER